MDSKKKRTGVIKRILKVNNLILRSSGKKPFRAKIVEYFNNIMKDESNDPMNLSPSEALSNFESFIVTSAKEVAEREEKNRPDWFTQSEEVLLHHIDLRNKAFKQHLISNTIKSHQNLKACQANLQRTKRIAKCKWQNFFAAKCQASHFKDNPKAAWEVVFQIIEGFNAHHSDYNPKTFSNKEGRISKNTEENTRTLKTHFQEVFNRDSEFDPTVIDDLTQLPIISTLDNTPTADEIRGAIKKMKNNKAPGLSGVTTDML